ncbi:hypothetical protein V491_09298, partial [Pseudogymnoascus sp. VKM F-3775]
IWSSEPYNLSLEAAGLVECAKEPERHWELLDKKVQGILTCTVPPWHRSKSLQTVRSAVAIITRLPQSSLRLSSNLWSTFNTSDSHYLHEPGRPSIPSNGEAPTSSWEKHKVVSMVDSNTILLALVTAHLNQTSHRLMGTQMTDYMKILSILLDEITAFEASLMTTLSGDLDISTHLHSCQVARAFVWTAWQRSLQISSYYFFGTRLRRECNIEDWYPHPPQPYEDLPFSVVGNLLKTEEQADQACRYMCRHSFDLVRLSSFSTQDFRTLILCYNNQFCNRNPRCYQEDSEWVHCKPSAPFCPRCAQSAPEDQSAHDKDCARSCQRIPWHRDSYLSTPAPRSVDLSLHQSRATLQYRRATDQTLAISHVWSHGQGGRPEEGFNKCLHNRYSALAVHFGCDSYWIDAACIPSDKNLRSEAIKTINPIFKHSKVTLICDRDIMSIDAQDLSPEKCETLVSVLLLSDWNTRAWTLLEAIRGNRAIHLLCKDNNPVALRDILSLLYNQGSITLCALLIGSPHLLPMSEMDYNVGLERAGVMLSRRFTSNEGDAIIIWSLLCGNDMAETKPERFWKARLRTRISTGFLMSTCERVNGVPGLSWAPATPIANPLAAIAHAKDTNTKLVSNPRVYWPHDSTTTVTATLLQAQHKNFKTPLFLHSSWYVYIVQPQDLKKHSTIPNSCWERAQQVLSLGEYKKVIFLRPSIPDTLLANSGFQFMPLQHLDYGEGSPVAVCATKDDREKFDVSRLATELTQEWELSGEEWEWKGVYAVSPNDSIDINAFEVMNLRIV